MHLVDNMDRTRLVEVLNSSTGDCKVFFRENEHQDPSKAIYAGKTKIPPKLLFLNEENKPDNKIQRERIGFFPIGLFQAEQELPDLFDDPDFDAFKH